MSESSIEVIDFHCHIASVDYFPKSFLEGMSENISRAIGARGVPSSSTKVMQFIVARMQDPLCDQLVMEMDEAGIHKAVLLLPDFTYALKDCSLTIEEMIERHRRVLERHGGRFFSFVGVDPRWGRDGVTLFEKAVRDYGFRGLKLYPPCGYLPSDHSLYPFYEICEQYGLPVLTHIGATSPALPFEHAQPRYVERAAYEFPNIDFVLAHGSVHYAEECRMLCSHRPNMYMDVSGYEIADDANLRALFSRNLSHKVLFGTDWPIFRLQGSQAHWVRRLVRDEGMFPQGVLTPDKRGFFSETAMRLLSKYELRRESSSDRKRLSE